MERLYDNPNDPIEQGKWYELPPEFAIACCHCSLVHEWCVKIRNGKICAKWKVDNKSTAQGRRHKIGELFGEHPKWKMIRK
jgi:hypothetical protein